MRTKRTKQINLMDRFARIGLVLVLTMLASAFLPGGWFGPSAAQAATYYMQASTASTIGVDSPCNLPAGAPSTFTGYPAKTVLGTAETGTGSRYYPAGFPTVGQWYIVERLYAPAYAANAMDISNISASFAIRGANAADQVRIDLYDYDPAGAAGNKTLVATGTAKVIPTPGTTVQVTWTAANFTINGTGRVAQGHHLLVETSFYYGGTAGVRFYFGIAGTTTSTNITVTETPFVCTDTDPATLTTTNPTGSQTVSGTVTIQTQVGTETTPSGMTGMVVNIAGSTACNVTNGVMTWNGTSSRWEYSWDTSACGTVTADTGITIDVRGYDPDCGGTTLVNAAQIANVTIDNTCPDSDPTTGVTLTPASSSPVKGTVTVQAAIAGESTPGAAGASATLTITGSDACNVTSQAMTWNSGNSRWEYSWNTATCGTVSPDTGVTISVDYADPDCPSKITNGTSSNITIDQTPWMLKSCGSCHSYPPSDGARDGATGAFAGDHQVHQAICSTCHIAPATETSADFKHRTGNIDMQAGATGIKGGYYDKDNSGTFTAGDDVFAQSNAPTTRSCVNISCHGGGTTPVWGVGTLGCTDCHNAAINSPVAQTLNAAVTQRRAIVPEFKNTWSHKRSTAGGVPANTVVNNEDCGVCHMEGSASTGRVNWSYHADGYIDLRDPDSGNPIEDATWSNSPAGAGSYASSGTALNANATPANRLVRFSRTLSSNTIEIQARSIQINQCLKCHDSNGAASTAARVPGGSAEKPFATTIAGAGYTGAGVTANGVAGGVTDIAFAFNPSNSTYHPVMGKQDNSYTMGARMAAPWNMTKTNGTPGQYGYLITCWDCHAPNGATGVQTSTVTAHGAIATLKGTVYETTNTLCKTCHLGYTVTTGNHGTGSAINSSTNSGMGTYMANQCQKCHASNDAAARPTKAEDAHGFNRLPWSAGTDAMWPRGATETYRPYAFIRNTQQWVTTSWKPLSGPSVPAGTATCGGTMSSGTCGDSMTTYTPGGAY